LIDCKGIDEKTVREASAERKLSRNSFSAENGRCPIGQKPVLAAHVAQPHRSSFRPKCRPKWLLEFSHPQAANVAENKSQIQQQTGVQDLNHGIKEREKKACISSCCLFQWSKGKPLTDRKSFWALVGEDGCIAHMEGCSKPVLRACPHASTTMAQNTGTGTNPANGTQGECAGVCLKPGHTAHHEKVNGHNAKCVHTSETERALWEVGGKAVEMCPEHCKTSTAIHGKSV
jgi:hypothetical protein